jgi:hypothetical protein
MHFLSSTGKLHIFSRRAATSCQFSSSIRRDKFKIHKMSCESVVNEPRATEVFEVCQMNKESCSFYNSIAIIDVSRIEEQDFFGVILPVECKVEVQVVDCYAERNSVGMVFDEIETETGDEEDEEDEEDEDLQDCGCSLIVCVANVWRWLFRCEKPHEDTEVEQVGEEDD